MERAERLRLLFSQDESLLRLDTQLRTLSEIQSKLESVHIHDHVNTNQEHWDPILSQSDQYPNESLKPDTINKQENKTKKGSERVAQGCESVAQEAPSHFTPLEGLSVSHDGTFSPLLTISRYPYKYVKGNLSQKVASRFFDAGKFWNRGWDLYYIKLPPRPVPRHLMLVPTAQVRRFFREINHVMPCNLALSGDGLVLPFHKEGFPQPVFIGRSTCREDKDRLESQIPTSSEWIRPPPGMDEQYLAFEEMIETAWDTTRNKRNPSKAKQQLRYQNQRRLFESLRRTQSYLGLHSGETDDMVDGTSWEKGNQQPIPGPPQPLRMDKPAPFPFWKEPVFISIDVESNERHHKQITEVGISTLDTLDLVGTSPADDGARWRTKIQSRHLRVEEYAHHVNRDFVAGCPGSFDFGTSEWVSANDLAAVVQASFEIPSAAAEHTDGRRHLVLVGHAITGDVQYLRQIGVRMPEDTIQFIDTVDTAEFFRVIRDEKTTRKLGDLLQEFNITGWHLHNAGNDARYTMEVMLCMILEHSRRGDRSMTEEFQG